jgi:hypothetical protein
LGGGGGGGAGGGGGGDHIEVDKAAGSGQGVRVEPKRILCNKLIANLMKGNTYCTSERILIDTVHSVFSQSEIFDARRLLFDFFPVIDAKWLDMGAKERRHNLRGHCEDIVNKVIGLCNVEHDVIFCLPWDAVFHDFISEEEKIGKEIIKQKDREIDAKFSDLEKRIDEKNKATIEAVKVMCDKIVKNSTCAPVPSSGVGEEAPGVPAPTLGQYARIVAGSAGFLSRINSERQRSSSLSNRLVEPVRDRSNSSKRKRLDENGAGVHVGPGGGNTLHGQAGSGAAVHGGQGGAAHAGPDSAGNVQGWNQVTGQRGHRAQKFVVGSGTRNGVERKMKTARADVFVYAVEPSTTVEDIVEDLSFSEVEVDPNHIVKKTRPESRLDCYRISVKREDLVKALQPDTWPAGVRVREWVHYPARRQPQQGAGGQGAVDADRAARA